MRFPQENNTFPSLVPIAQGSMRLAHQSTNTSPSGQPTAFPINKHVYQQQQQVSAAQRQRIDQNFRAAKALLASKRANSQTPTSTCNAISRSDQFTSVKASLSESRDSYRSQKKLCISPKVTQAKGGSVSKIASGKGRNGTMQQHITCIAGTEVVGKTVAIDYVSSVSLKTTCKSLPAESCKVDTLSRLLDEDHKRRFGDESEGAKLRGQRILPHELDVDFDETTLAEIDRLCGQRAPLGDLNRNLVDQRIVHCSPDLHRQRKNVPSISSFLRKDQEITSPEGPLPGTNRTDDAASVLSVCIGASRVENLLTTSKSTGSEDLSLTSIQSTVSQDPSYRKLHLLESTDGSKFPNSLELARSLQNTPFEETLGNTLDNSPSASSIRPAMSDAAIYTVPISEHMLGPCSAPLPGVNYVSPSCLSLETVLGRSADFPVPTADTMPAYLQTLNESQREAALSDIAKPLLILAGPGSGKTSTMVARLLRMLEEGVHAKNILAMTFTTAAASEMKERVGAVAGKVISNELTVCTFHSFCLQLCRSNAEKLGRTPEFLIYGHGQQRKAVSEATRLALEELRMAKNVREPANSMSNMASNVELHNENASPASWKERARKWQKFVTQAKAAGSSPEDFEKLGNTVGAAILRYYDATLSACDALDYYDFISSSVKLLRDHPEVLTECQTIWTHLLVDEFQDTSAMQYQFLHLLASHSRITAVGDDDQSIFSFNGADSTGFESFRKDFTSLKEVRLQQNYRSTRCIVEASSALIQNNLNRCKTKKCFTDNNSGEKIVVKECRNEDAQCAFVVDTILLNCGANDEHKHPYGSIAILYRRQVTGRIFQSALRARRIPFNVHGVAFYRKKVIKNVIAMLCTALKGGKDLSCRRVFKALYSGDKAETKKVVEYVEKVANSSKCGFLQTARSIFTSKVSGTFNRRQLAQGRKVLMSIDMIHRLARKERSLSALVTTVVNLFPQRSAFEKRAVVDEDGGKLLNEDDDRRTVLDYFLDDISDFLRYYFPPNAHLDCKNDVSEKNGEGCLHVLKSFLDHIMSRESENFRSRREENKNSITLTTMHQSKGLEWDIVFIVKANDSEVPLVHETMGGICEGSSSLEEERRLFYVAMTRARKKLYIVYVVLDSRWQLLCPSRFLRELPRHLLDIQVDSIALNGNMPLVHAAVDHQRNCTERHQGRQRDCADLAVAQEREQGKRQLDCLYVPHTGKQEGEESVLSSLITAEVQADFGATSVFLRGFNMEARSTVAALFHCWARKSAFQDPKRLLDKVGFVIDERLRNKGTKNKDLLRALKCSLKDETAFSYAQYVIKWGQMPLEERSVLLAEKKEHFQQHSAERSMATTAASSKQISYLRSLGCTTLPTSRLHASHLIEQYKSL